MEEDLDRLVLDCCSSRSEFRALDFERDLGLDLDFDLDGLADACERPLASRCDFLALLLDRFVNSACLVWNGSFDIEELLLVRSFRGCKVNSLLDVLARKLLF